jgi:hypothetical protein
MYFVCRFYKDVVGEKEVESKPEYTEETGQVETVATLSEIFRQNITLAPNIISLFKHIFRMAYICSTLFKLSLIWHRPPLF